MTTALALWILSTGSVAPSGELCSTDCLVELEQPRAEYPRDATIRLAVRNTSADTISIVAVLDAFVAGEWRETPLTVSDQDHPYKAVRLSPVRPGAAFVLTYPACASLKVVPKGGGGRDVLTRCPKDVASPAHPMRLHVFVTGQGNIRQEVVSPAYRVRPE